MWKLLFRQTLPMVKSKADWMTTNINDPENPNYSIIAQLENYRGRLGAFELKMTWPMYTKSAAKSNIWRQSSNPINTKASGVAGYTPIDVAFSAGFSGLEWHTSGSTLLDGNVGGNWWFAIGTATPFGGGLPGPNNIVQKQVELRVCDESAITTPDPSQFATPAPTVLTFNDTTSDFTCEFDYAETSTPVFSSIHPRSGNGATKVTITGVNIGATPTVHVGEDVCEMLAFGEDADNTTHNVQTITCEVPAMTAGWYHVKIHVPGQGFAAHPDSEEAIHTFESELKINSIQPAAGSWSGGMLVTVTGGGFSSRLRNNTVAIEVGNETRAAHVLQAAHGELVVVMPSFEREDANGTFAMSANASLVESCITAANKTTCTTTDNTTTCTPVVTCTPVAVPTSGIKRSAKILVAVQADLMQLEVFGQTSPIAHRYAAGTDPVALVASEMRRDFDKSAAKYVKHENATAGMGGWVERTRHYAGTSECSNMAACAFEYTDAVTPTITAVSPTKGSRGDVLTLTGTGLVVGSGSTYDVRIGDQPCDVDDSSVTSTQVKCTLGSTPAGKHRVYFTNGDAGTARVPASVTFESELKVLTVSHVQGGFGGGQLINITGSGFGGGTARAARRRRDGAWGGWTIYEYNKFEEATVNLGASVSMCNQECTVVSSNYNSIQCYTPEVKTPESLRLTDMYESQLLTGKVIFDDVAAANEDTFTRAGAFDRLFDRAFESENDADNANSTCYTGLDFGAGAAAVVSKVRWFPVHQQRYKVVGGVFQGSNDNVGWTTLHTVTESTEAWNFADIKPVINMQDGSDTSFRYVRYAGPSGSNCLIAELEFVGQVVSPTNKCNIMIGTQAPLSHPSLGPSETEYEVVSEYSSGMSYTYLAGSTPIVTSISPPYGSSLGDTDLTITGTDLPTSAGSASVVINGRPCEVKSAAANGKEVVCTTTRRTDFRPLSVKVRDTDSTQSVGYALHARATHYRYLDRWSQVNTWLNDEPPIEGDTVVIPSDQSILVDVPLPKLFLVLIQGFLMFEPNLPYALNMDASYILVYGGALIAGTEDQPFDGDLTFTLHGDRYTTVEIPNFGSKVLAVADKGGLSSSSFAMGAGHEVPLSQKGILDIHGKRRLKTWTNTAQTAHAGDNFIITDKPVDFAAGETIVITGHVKTFTGAPSSNDKDGDMPPPCFYPSPAEMTTEELTVVEVTDGGLRVVFEEPLQYDHQSEIITTPQGRDVSVQAQVALLTRNIVIQGDEGSTEQLFGSHTIAVHGGHFRVENTEVRRCGQARNLGRYCLHYHKTGYNPPPNSYLKSNSIHHSFQRATTIHGTQHALVSNNVAYRVMGHNYFVEDGDEEYVVLEGNLGIETLTTPYSLLSDCQAATFWTATPKNIWRNNVAANSHGNGFWFELDAGAAGDFTKSPTIEVSGNNFHDNNQRGWFIAPKYLPETPQYFRGNTYARNHMDGVFYGVGGDTHHVKDNFVSNSGNGDLLWWFFPSRESSRWIPNMKDVTFTGGMYNPGKGARKLPRPVAGLFAPNMEFFLVDGAEFTNYTDGSAITQCFDCCGYRSRQGAYTTRFANLKFENSARRTSFACPEKQIFMDLDGSLTSPAGDGTSGDAGASVTAYHAFNEWEECPRADDTFSKGLVCNSSVRVRKLQIPVDVNVPKVYAPVTNTGRGVFLKKSKMIDPYGFVAVFESGRANASGAVRSIERKAILKAVAGFLGLDQRHVAETTMPAQAKGSQGIAVQIGGHLDVVSKNDDLGRKHVEVSHDGLCETGVVKADLLSYPGVCVNAYGRRVPHFAQHNETDLTPQECVSWCNSYTQGTGCEHRPGKACSVIVDSSVQRGTIDDGFASAEAAIVSEHGHLGGWVAKLGPGDYTRAAFEKSGGRSNGATTIHVAAGYKVIAYDTDDLTQKLATYGPGRHGMVPNDRMSSLQVLPLTTAAAADGWPAPDEAVKMTCWTTMAVPTHPFVGCFVPADSTESADRTLCLQLVQAELDARSLSQGRKTLVVGSWNHVPPGCSYQSGGDNAAHFNTNPRGCGAPNCGGYTTGVDASLYKTVSQCRLAAKDKGYSYFSMSNPSGQIGNNMATGTAECKIMEHRPKVARTEYTASCAELADSRGYLLGGSNGDALYETYSTDTGGNVRHFRLQDFWGQLTTVGILQKPVACTQPGVVQPECPHKHTPMTTDITTSFDEEQQVQFTKIAGRTSSQKNVQMPDEDFNKAFAKSASKMIVRVCSTCTGPHKFIVYKRLTPVPAGMSLMNNLVKSWMSANNELAKDFNLYSSWKDAVAGTNPWQYCNYDDTRVGMPRDCGPTGAIGNQWITAATHDWAMYVDQTVPECDKPCFNGGKCKMIRSDCSDASAPYDTAVCDCGAPTSDSCFYGEQCESKINCNSPFGAPTKSCNPYVQQGRGGVSSGDVCKAESSAPGLCFLKPQAAASVTTDFDRQGAGTVCAMVPGTVVSDDVSGGFPVKAFHGQRQCKVWGDESTQYDAIDYYAPSWTRDVRHQTQNFRRHRRESAAGESTCKCRGTDVCSEASHHTQWCYIDSEDSCTDSQEGSNGQFWSEEACNPEPICVEWKCAKENNFGECMEEYCYRAQTGDLSKPTWMTWIKGEIPNRDDKCITWHCHEPGVAAAQCSVFRCTWSSENRQCTEYHPEVVAKTHVQARVGEDNVRFTSLPIGSGVTADDCRDECDKVNCTAFHFLPNRYGSKASCSASGYCTSKAEKLTWTDTDGDGAVDPLCRLNDGTYSSRQSASGCKVVYGAAALQFRSMPTCTLYNTPAYALVASTSLPGSSVMDVDGNAIVYQAPLAGECFRRKLTASQEVQLEQHLKDPKCFPALVRPHSETTCRTVVPQVDMYGGVNWHKKGSTGELWNNRVGLDQIYYGPGKNGPNSFDWFGWTIPLVTHHDYIADWDWHDDFEQFSMRWAVPWILQNPDHGAAGTNVDITTNVAPDARFKGTKSFNPLKDESALVSFAYEDYRYRYKVDKPSQIDVPWFDIHSDDCTRSTCSRRLANTEKRSRGTITRHDAFGVGMIDRMDESLKTTGTGGEWKVALNPWYGVNMCASRPTPIDFSLTVEVRQCPPNVCRLGGYVDYGSKMYWSNLTTWETLAFAEKADAEASATAIHPAEFGVVEIPEGYHVVLDVDPPLLHKVTVYGKLSFLDDHDRELQFENMVVQGNFSIGTKETPFKHKATISVHGNRSTASLVVSDQHHLSNKAIANFGEIQWHGRTPNVAHAKLERTAEIGDTQLYMDSAVDWLVEDTIVITSTDYSSNMPTTQTGTYTGNTFEVLPGPDELTSMSEEVVITNVSADGRLVSINRPVSHRHFAGEISVGFDKNNVLIETSAGKESVVVRAMKIAYGPAKFTGNASNAADIAAYTGDRSKLHGWYGLERVALVDATGIDTCNRAALPVGTYSARSLQIVVAYESANCNAETQSANLLAAGADGLVLVDDTNVNNLISEKGMQLPTMVVGFGDGTRMLEWIKAGPPGAVTLRAKPMVLKASVGNLNRGVVVRGIVQEACTAAEHSANLKTYTNNCQERNMPHHVCKDNGFVPHDCYYMKGYGLTITTGELNWGSKDAYTDAQTSGVATRPAKVGQIFAKGVEFVNTGKLSMKHHGFVINYWNEYGKDQADNVIDHCVWRNSWQDGIVSARANELTVTNNVIHRTLGIGISTGDDFVNWGAGGKRSRKSMQLAGEVPWGGKHTINGNLVSDSFHYPFQRPGYWHSGIMLRQSLASFKGNVAAGSHHGGITLQLQDKANEVNHTIDNNEAYANKYGMIVKVHRAGMHELYGFKAWKNERNGVVSFQEPGSYQLRKNILADNKYGAGVGFLGDKKTFRVIDSVVVGVSAATDTSKTCPAHRIGIMLPRYGKTTQCEGVFGPCKECNLLNNAMDERFSNTRASMQEHFFAMDSTFAHFGTGTCKDAVGIAINPTEPDYTPDTHLSQLNWLPNVADTSRIRLGDTTHIAPECEKSCDAVDYMRFFDEDGSTIGDVWKDGSPDNFGNSAIMSDINPATTIGPKCRADTKTASIVCRNYPQVMVGVEIPPPCEGCEPPEFITVHKYGAEGPNQIANSAEVKVRPDPALKRWGLTNDTYMNSDGKYDGIEGFMAGRVEDTKYNRRTYWSRGAFEMPCSCQEHFMGAGFPVEPGNLVYDFDLPVNPDLNREGEYKPEWMPPNTVFSFKSQDPNECVTSRMWFREAKPVHVFLNGKSMDSRKLIDGTLPPKSSAAGTNVYDPQSKRFHLTMCGTKGGSAEYTLRVKESVQVTMAIEMDFEEFFAETKAADDANKNLAKLPESLYQRIVGLERLVNNLANLLTIPRNKIKVACVHKIGEPCIPSELTSLFGGYNPSGGRHGRARRAGGTSTWNVGMELIPPFQVNETGSADALANNTAFFDQMTGILDGFGSNSTALTDAIAKDTNISLAGVGVTKSYGTSANEEKSAVLSGDVVMGEFTTTGTTTTTITNTTTPVESTNAAAETSDGDDHAVAIAVSATVAVMVLVLITVFVLYKRSQMPARGNKGKLNTVYDGNEGTELDGGYLEAAAVTPAVAAAGGYYGNSRATMQRCSITGLEGDWATITSMATTPVLTSTVSTQETVFVQSEDPLSKRPSVQIKDYVAPEVAL